jgi:hypothetical protein
MDGRVVTVGVEITKSLDRLPNDVRYPGMSMS